MHTVLYYIEHSSKENYVWISKKEIKKKSVWDFWENIYSFANKWMWRFGFDNEIQLEDPNPVILNPNVV